MYALLLYTGCNVAATLASIPAGRAADRLGTLGPVSVLTAGVGLFAAAYTEFALTGASLAVLTLPFAAAGIAIGCVETAEHAAVAAFAPAEVRGSAFGLLAAAQAAGNLAASAVAGVLWTTVSPAAASGTSSRGCCSPSDSWPPSAAHPDGPLRSRQRRLDGLEPSSSR